MDKEKQEKLKTTTFIYCALIYFVSFYSVNLVQDDKVHSYHESWGGFLATVIAFIFVPIMLIAIASSMKNSKYAYFEFYSLIFYIGSLIVAIYINVSIAYLLTNLIPIFGFIIFLIEGKKS